MKNQITNEKIKKYFNLTEMALSKIKKNIISGKESEAKEIIEMASNYVFDARHFFNKENFVNAFGALNYAHGWIDCGVRTKVFNVKDNKLFTIC